MRKIKFRGKIEGNWWYVRVSNMYTSGSWEQFWTLVDKKTVGQYIGLKDKNDKEIYEGDIIKGDWHWEEPHRFVYPDDYYWLQEVSLEGDNLEVIGNIYDNPGLLPAERT